MSQCLSLSCEAGVVKISLDISFGRRTPHCPRLRWQQWSADLRSGAFLRKLNTCRAGGRRSGGSARMRPFDSRSAQVFQYYDEICCHRLPDFDAS
jgi:hypothetical protein